MDSQDYRPCADSEREPGYKPRRVPRMDVDRPTNLRPQNWYEVEVQVRNVSACGFMVECGQPVRIGSYIVLDVPGIGPVNAQVRWQVGQKMGGLFIDPISLGQCEWTAAQAENKGQVDPIK